MHESVGTSKVRRIGQQVLAVRNPHIKTTAGAKRPICAIEERSDVEYVLENVGRDDDVEMLDEGQGLGIGYNWRDPRLSDHALEIGERDVYSGYCSDAPGQDLSREIAFT